MPKRPLTAVLAALALLAAAPAVARAQDAPPDATREVKEIYDDFADDGVVDSCDHTLDDLQEALDTIEPDFEQDFPDFRAALEASVNDHVVGECDDAGDGGDPSPTATPSATGTPGSSGDLYRPERDSSREGHPNERHASGR